MKMITMWTIVVLCCNSALAYEVDTHSLVTSNAFERSLLEGDELLERMGLDRFQDDNAGAAPLRVPEYIEYSGQADAYLDILSQSWNQSFDVGDMRVPQKYDWENMYSLAGEEYRDAGRDSLRLKGWLMRGVVREDDVPVDGFGDSALPEPDPHGEIVRVFHHFFDPVHGDALSISVPCNLLPTISKCERSPDWAMGRDEVTSVDNPPVNSGRRNHFSWADAREAMWCGLTRNVGNPHPINLADRNAAERRICWATALDSLGHVLHLLQDSAQPQHVRNDPHNKSDGWKKVFNASIDRRTYEAWTNFRTLNGKEVSGRKDEDAEFRAFFGEKAKNPPAIAPGLNYPIPRFSEPQHYFTTRQVETAITPASLRKRRGIADFANRSMFSEGTQFSTHFPLPPSDVDSGEFSVKERVLTDFPGDKIGIERHYTTPLVDPLKGSYTDLALAEFDNAVPLSTISLWADFNTGQLLPDGGVISLDDYSAHADVLLPRAIAYSAGLIDYFFRGKLEITPPLDGLFSVIDDGTPHKVNAGGRVFRDDNGEVFGFTKVRLRVRNATDVVNESGTNLPIPRDIVSTGVFAEPLQGDPTLVAVARYQRNPCYKPDLSGERRVAFDGKITEAVGCGNAGTRTPFQELSVSRPVASSAASINGAGQDLVFDFSQQPIPVNATDLVIQVVYRGPLGLESDAIAVGTFDVREPTYITHWNNSDYAACNGGWFANGATPPGCIVEGVTAQRAILTTRVCIGTQLVFEHFDNPHGSLGTGKFVRLVALMDDKIKATRSRSIVHDLNTIQIRNRTIAGHLRQSAKEQVTAQAPFVSDPFWSKRGLVGSLRPLPFYQVNGADPQPANDAGALDVGALTNPLAVAPAPDPGNVLFPDVAVSNMTCTTANAKAVFDDEIAQQQGKTR